MAIKFHYHRAVRATPRLGIRRGDRLCHVYSDTSLEELIAWGETRGWKKEYLDLRNDLPHFDAFRTRLRFCGEPVTTEEFKRDIRRWRRSNGGRRRKKPPRV